MLKILNIQNLINIVKYAKICGIIFLYLDCMYYETNLNQFRFLICRFLRNMQIHKVPSPANN